MTWDRLASLSPEEIREQDAFPYPSLPHPLQTNGGQVFPKMQIQMFPRLERFDVDFDLPDAFIPEFPPAIFLSNRPELGDVSRGEVVSINNYYRLFKPILTPVQLDGLRLLLTPFPQEEFNPTDDRKSREPSLGVTCLDCHVNRDTTGAVPFEPRHVEAGYAAARKAPAPRYCKSAGRPQSADPWLQAQFAIGGGLYGIRATHRLL